MRLLCLILFSALISLTVKAQTYTDQQQQNRSYQVQHAATVRAYSVAPSSYTPPVYKSQASSGSTYTSSGSAVKNSTTVRQSSSTQSAYVRSDIQSWGSDEEEYTVKTSYRPSATAPVLPYYSGSKTKNCQGDCQETLKTRDKDIVYTGNTRDGYPHGKGIFKWSNGTVYTGEIKDGLYEGKGTLVFASGVVHKGEYKKGKYDGEGYIDYGKGSYFKGIFRNGSPSKGEYRYEDGAVFVGDFVNGELGGKGTLTFTNGNRYTGEFKNGTYHGQGEFKFLESVFTGEYRNGNPYFGTYKYNTGNEFTGFLHENWGRKVGEYRKEGAVYHGWFNEAGLYEGYGIQENEDGTKAEGEWLNGDNTGFTLMYIKALDKTVIGKLNYKGPGIWGVVSYKDKFYSGKMDDEGNMDYLEGNDEEHTRVYSEAMQYIRAGRKAYTDIMNKK